MSARKFVTSITTSSAAPLGRIAAVGGDFIAPSDLPDLSGTYQPLDADLTAIAALAGTNTIYYRSGAGTWSAVTVGSGLSFAGGTLSCTVSPGTGTVTSVGLALPAMFTVTGSPVTGAGTLTAALASQPANLVFAGPSSGASATPGFRSLAGADIPAFGAAGPTHAKGGVPDPGATAHGLPYYLGDDGAWHKPAGVALGQSCVQATETTTSTTPVGLTTAQTITFTLTEASPVIIRVFARCANTAAGASVRLDFDNGLTQTRIASGVCDTAAALYSVAGEYCATFPAGAWTITLLFSVSAGTGSFQNRAIDITYGAP